MLKGSHQRVFFCVIFILIFGFYAFSAELKLNPYHYLQAKSVPTFSSVVSAEKNFDIQPLQLLPNLTHASSFIVPSINDSTLKAMFSPHHGSAPIPQPSGGYHQGWMDDRWVRDAVPWLCLPGCVDSNDENPVSIATGETIDGYFPLLWAVTTFWRTDVSPARRSILIAVSNDGGSSWSWWGAISSNNGRALLNPDIAIDPGRNPDRLYITFEYENELTNHDVCIARWDIDGNNFGAGCTTSTRNETNPRVAVEYNMATNYAVFVYEYWTSSTNSDIVAYRSTDGGTNWSGSYIAQDIFPEKRPDITVGADSSGNSYFHLVFIDLQNNSMDRIGYSKASRGDLTQLSNNKVYFNQSNGTLTNSTPAIQATHGGGRVLFITDETSGSDYQLRYGISQNNGSSFDFYILNESGNQRYPSLATENAGRTNNDNTRDIFWLAFWTGTGGTGRIESWQTDSSNYSVWYSDTPFPYVDDDSLASDMIHTVAITDIQDLYPGVAYVRQGSNKDIYYGTKGDTYTIDSKDAATLAHVDVPVTVDTVTYPSPAVFIWPAYGVHTLEALIEYDDASWHWGWVSWSDGGTRIHNIVADYARYAQPPPVTEFDAYYSKCTLSPPEVNLILCNKVSGGAVHCAWSPLASEDADDFAVWRSTVSNPWSSWLEWGRTGSASNTEFTDSSAVGNSIFYYLVQAICGSGGHDHRGPTGYNGP